MIFKVVFHARDEVLRTFFGVNGAMGFNRIVLLYALLLVCSAAVVCIAECLGVRVLVVRVEVVAVDCSWD